MNIEEFTHSISKDEKPPEVSRCLQALWWAQKGDWSRAHDIAQEIQESEAGRPVKRSEDLAEEWHEIVGELLNSQP